MSDQTFDSNLRDFSERERGYISRMMEAEFRGKAEILRQIETATVRQIDADGSIEILPGLDIAAPAETPVPVQASAPDIDGVPIYLLLHVLEWKAQELEIYKADGSLIRRYPEPDELEVMALSP
ncbi:MAG TPA: hypothetical protein VGF48_08270 [Thermoanaerobaculia bacterium]|jgi:hypothetical protein